MRMVCSRCGKELGDYIVRLESSITVLKRTPEEIYTPYTNLAEPTGEYLCPDCFDKYCDALNALNEEYEGKYVSNIVEVVDDIQYGDN